LLSLTIINIFNIPVALPLFQKRHSY